MVRQTKSSLFKKLFFSKIFLLFYLIILVLVSYSLSEKVLQKRQVENEVKSLAEEVAVLEKDRQELSEMIEYVKNISFAEREARLKLGLSKPDESVVIIAGEEEGIDKDKESEGSGAGDGKKNYSNFRLWWNYFFDY